jgi:hypothetical protein
MPPDDKSANKGWKKVQQNPTYRCGALSESEGSAIKWHSPVAPDSSQVFCISTFGELRALPDGFEALNRLLAKTLPNIPAANHWELQFEYVEKELLGETGLGEATNVDVLCTSKDAVVCIESKFHYDATEGFGGCGQARRGDCAGHYGPESDKKTGTKSHCRLEVQDGKRDPRNYWRLGRRYFKDTVFREQRLGEKCPFAESNYQLMRNLLLAATKARQDQEFGVVAMVPEKISAKVRTQVSKFRQDILGETFQSRINVGSYDTLAAILLQSPHKKSIALGEFLTERMTALL